MQKIYLDHASTTPVDPAVWEAIRPFFNGTFGNASSPHSFGREAARALEDARQTLASFIGAKADEVIFTSGATESNNQAVYGIAQSLKHKGNHIVASRIEHHSVLRPMESLCRDGFKVTYVTPDDAGIIHPDDIRKAVTKETILIAVMHASNEIGSIQPVSLVGAMAREQGIPFLVDAVQTVGHVPVDVTALNADLLSLSAHKFYGPKGVGALYIRKGTKVASLFKGGDQERGLRASTQNVPGAVGMARAAEVCRRNMDEEIAGQTQLRDRLVEGVLQRVEDVKLNGHRQSRLPNNAHFSFKGIEGEALLMSLDMEGIAASMGSACTSGAMEPSHVLKAIGLDDELAYGSLRVTVGRWTTQAEVDRFLDILPGIVSRLRI